MTEPTDIKVLKYIKDYLDKHGFPPAFRDIQADLGYASVSTVSHWVHKLEDDELIERDMGKARGMKITEEGYKVIREN